MREFIRKQNLIRRGDRILLGLSGGADSVCLFYLLLGMREEFGFTLRAVHVHHGIRADADADAAYVKTLCEREDVRCYFFREDIPACAKEQGLSEEEAGRILRYADFKRCLEAWQEEESGQEEPLRYKTATAHHRNDQAETVLFQLFRGCGLAGLRGILSERDCIIRPLLCLSREETERFLRERGVSWCEDETNREEGCSRNKIRHRILPYAEREINRDAAAHIAKTAEIVREACDYIGRQTQKAYSRVAEEQEGLVVFDIPVLHGEDAFLQKELVLHGLKGLQASGRDIGAVHVEDILRLSEKRGNGELSLPGGIRVQKSYQKLIMYREGNGSGADRDRGGNGEAWGMPPATLFAEMGFLCGEKVPEIEWERIDLAEEEAVKKRFGVGHISEIMKCIPQKTYTKWFDYDKIKMPFSVRHPESRDYLTIDREMRHKRFRRYMIENKVPVSCRNHIWLVADESHVIWVPGGRMSEYYKVTAETKTILQMRICREK